MSSILDDPNLDPDLRMMILRVKKEFDEIAAKVERDCPACLRRPEPDYTNPGCLAPRSDGAATAGSPPPLPSDPVALFDRDAKFGPRIGMTRLARYNRAVFFGDAPDPRVLEAIRANAALGAFVYTG